MKITPKIVFTLLCFFIISNSFAQNISDAELGFDVSKISTFLQQRGASVEEINQEIAKMRKLYARLHLSRQKNINDILQKNKLADGAKTGTQRSSSTSLMAADVPQTERDALKAIYDISTSKSNLKGWDFSTTVASWNESAQTGWKGVTVTNGHVSALIITSDFNLNGQIPTKISQLPELTLLNISGNFNLQGAIPSEIGQLQKLNMISFSGNALSGPIPESIGSLSGISYLEINESLTGMISYEFANMFNLQYLIIQNTNLTGELDSMLFHRFLPNIIELSIIGNLNLGFGDVFYFPSAEIVDLSFNKFSTNIQRLGGPNLREVNLSHNQLTGTLPTLIENIKVLDLSYNKITGSIPVFSNIANLSDVRLNNNLLSGKVSPQVAQGFTSNLKTLELQSNKFTFLDLANLVEPYKAPLAYTPQAKIQTEQTINIPVGNSASLSMYTSALFTHYAETFQWYKGIYPNGTLIAGATDFTYTIPKVTSADAGKYYCLSKNPLFATDIFGKALILEREPITLSVLCPPVTGIIIKNNSYPFQFSNPGSSTAVLACNQKTFPVRLYACTSKLTIGTQLYTDDTLVTPVANGNVWYHAQHNATSYKVDISGKITEIYSCSTSACDNRFLDSVTVVAQDGPITLNYALYDGTQVSKTFQPVARGGDQLNTFSVLACINEPSLSISGPLGRKITSWNDNRNCCANSFNFSTSSTTTATQACQSTTFPNKYYSSSNSLAVGTQLYLDINLQSTVSGGNTWRKESSTGFAYKIDNQGKILEIDQCIPVPTTTNLFMGRHGYRDDNEDPDYMIYIDRSGNERKHIFSLIDIPNPNDPSDHCISITFQYVIEYYGVYNCTTGEIH
ncbi:hypothetical protein B4N84_15590 [Flavobacterium sp. IR1]|nr:hypothetical protein B4N84_15590 [Flavobacterium sp. IR1]